MGLFDGFEAGWNSFKNKELKQLTQPIWERESTPEEVKQVIKETTQPIWERESTAPIVDQAIKETTQPIWERESTEKILGEDGADKLQDTLNPARWAENAIDDSALIPDGMKGTVKTILPAVLISGGALLLVKALK